MEVSFSQFTWSGKMFNPVDFDNSYVDIIILCTNTTKIYNGISSKTL